MGHPFSSIGQLRLLSKSIFFFAIGLATALRLLLATNIIALKELHDIVFVYAQHLYVDGFQSDSFKIDFKVFRGWKNISVRQQSYLRFQLFERNAIFEFCVSAYIHRHFRCLQIFLRESFPFKSSEGYTFSVLPETEYFKIVVSGQDYQSFEILAFFYRVGKINEYSPFIDHIDRNVQNGKVTLPGNL